MTRLDAPLSLDALRQIYACPSPERDEWLPRWDQPGWSDVLGWLMGQGGDALGALSSDLQHQLREHGATFDPQHQQNRTLDLFPWLFDLQEWHTIEAGLIQRRELLSRVLKDLYGPQTLLRDGILPPELIYRNAGFLLPCHDLLPEAMDWLVTLGCDLGRDADGRMTVFGDCSQSPGGMGYVLENRLAINQVVPELTQHFDKRHLAAFFKDFQRALVPQTPYASEPLIGLLTRNYRDSQYFEHAFLANYLDLALVHGADLMFREGRIWLKTLSGLQPVDALIRYMPDHLSDPLELDSDIAGSPGLLQAIRQGNLVCANPPGAGLVDSGALLPFMEKLCRHLLDEDLLLPSVPAYWCGDPEHCEIVLDELIDMVVHDLAVPDQRISFANASRRERAALAERIKADPQRFVARRILPLSTVPVWQKQSVQCRFASLRTFVLHQAKHDQVLPGGLARCHEQALQLQLGLTSRFTAKDVWLQSPDGDSVSLLHSALTKVRLSRKSGLLPSRVADHLFWLGRYSERLNLACRAMRAALPLISTLTRDEQVRTLTPLVEFACTINGGVFMPTEQEDELTHQLTSLFLYERKDGLLSVLQALIMNAQSVREFFSEDTWYVLERLQNALNQFPARGSVSRMDRALDEIILLQSAIYGLNNETMSRTQTLRFMDIGQHIERAQQTTALLHKVFVKYPQPGSNLMEAVLRMADTLMTYRRRYRTELHPVAIIDLLLLDEGTPRSVGYQCARLKRQVSLLPERDSTLTGLNAEQRLMVELVSLLQLVDLEALVSEQGEPSSQLDELLTRINNLLTKLSEAITLAYFNHADIPRPIDDV
ncbi:circularly permuted type 2 ATP-grasp protein [Marinobacter sp. JSM 1782161]|uniref:circularly permuted type 2 ATP-grasp protein n=1 Tax=Marinobacter sp. JSM 1782161 TaxID=2685906 RepID=UPI001403033F|nr:circularly permuted type 2 ATP-grasp protein [Marinobacter sp. JSM 1782161]